MEPTSIFRLSWLESPCMKGERYFPPPHPMPSAVWREAKGESEERKKYRIDQTDARINFLWRLQCLHPSKTTRVSTKCLRVSTIQPPGTNSNIHKSGTNYESQYHPTRKLRNTKIASASKMPQTKLTWVHIGTIKCKNKLPSVCKKQSF